MSTCSTSTSKLGAATATDIDTIKEETTMAGVEYRMPQPLKLDTTEDLLPKWRLFKQQFKIFVSASGLERVSDTRKAAILLNCAGHEVQELYFNVLKTKTEETIKYEQLLKSLDDYFEPKENELISTFAFHKRCQEEGENFDLFYTDLRKLVKTCNYKDQEERMLRDRIVLGVLDKKLQRKLLEVNDLSLQKVVDMCRASELSQNHIKKMYQQQATVAVEAVQSSQPQNTQDKPKDKYNSVNNRDILYNCKKCGTRHKPRNCPAFGKICHNCNKPNHYIKGCEFINEIGANNEVITVNSVSDNNNVHDL